ncbi:membrane protein involved in aromatic hydrocarbon degradation [hydrothermal vent metagenome]|uniref:Membrane protein involved in aromatic hydrocarbon degradation n=1 Tax=hydrothermal vent metagenome TaxID=652676 RepID=A0A1W1EH55_9ZZZZ
MKKVIILSMATASLLLATNGDNMIGLGPESRALGGTGIAIGMGADSVFKNPAWLVDTQGLVGMFGATIFMPTINAKVGATAGGNNTEVESSADTFLIPEIAITDHITDDLSYGFGMFGVSGMGVDYRGEAPATATANMRTNLQYMRFVPSISYKMGDLRIGIGATISYGSLNISALDATGVQRGGGVSEDFGFGFQVGLGYHISDTLNIGLYYQSEVETEYENAYDFNSDGIYDTLKLSQPTEYGVGIAYINGDFTITADYRKILWSEADGYDNFGWADQDVFAIGTAYTMGNLTLRAGYNYAESPLKDLESLAPTTPAIQQNIFFNMLGFPAFSDTHYSLGLGYEISEKMGIDLAYVYAPDVTVTSPMGIESSNEQNSITFAIRYKFD